MKKALVLSGGGTKGAYQAGVLKALVECGMDDWDIVTGTSVGALHAALIVQREYKDLFDIYSRLEPSKIIGGYLPKDKKIENIVADRKEIKQTLVRYMKDKGLDVEPLKKNIHDLFHPDLFFASPVDFGCVVAEHKGHNGVYVTKDMMRDNGEKWLLASASAFPVFPVCVIDGREYVDGGYYDNLPIDEALRMGADEVLAIDLNPDPIHPQFVQRDNMIYMFPKADTGDFLDFSEEKIRRLLALGYNDGHKITGRYAGHKYTFHPYAPPRAFYRWYREVEMLETKIYQVSRIGQLMRSQQYIVDTIAGHMHLGHVSSADLFDGLMDEIMDLFDMDDEKVYSLDGVYAELYKRTEEVRQEDHGYRKGVLELAKFTTRSDRCGVMLEMLHMMYYPEHVLFKEESGLMWYPLERAVAGFLFDWFEERGNR